MGDLVLIVMMLAVFNPISAGVKTNHECDSGGRGFCHEPAIPEWCFDPQGTDCSFYDKCLEKRHPCDQSGPSYAIGYGLKFCSLFREAYSKFSPEGQRWVDAVRKCLQVELARLFEGPGGSISCQRIMTIAFDTHAGCYLSPAPGAPSVCDLGWKDRMRLLWTIKGSLLDRAAVKQTLSQMVEVAATCLGHDDLDLYLDIFLRDL